MKLPVKYDTLSPREKKQVREQYEVQQKFKCCHCGELLNGPPPEKVSRLPIIAKLFPPGFFDHPVHLHHSHRTGLTIGAVHCKCNAVLWQYERK